MKAYDHAVLDAVQTGIAAWVDIMGVDPKAKTWKMSDWYGRRTYEAIGKAQKVDPSGMAALLLLRRLLREYEREATFKTSALLRNWTKVKKELDKVRVAWRAIRSKEALAAVGDLRRQLWQVAKHYNCADAKVKEIVLDDEELAVVYLSAMRALAELREDRFAIGKPGTEPLKVNRTILEAWNINTMLRLVPQLPHGISLAMVRDPNPEQIDMSYFLFIGRDGGNLATWTDRPEMAHPDARSMMRARHVGKEFNERVAGNLFPYALLDYARVDDGKQIKVNARTAIVPIGTDIHPLCPLEQVPDAESKLWCMIVMEGFAGRMRSEEWRTKKLSYTGEMAITPQLTSTMLPMVVKDRKPLIIPPADPKTLAKELGGQDKDLQSSYTWIDEAYGHQVGQESLQFYPTEPPPKLLAPPEGFYSSHRDDEQNELDVGKQLDPRYFGTAAELKLDARWASRRNQIYEINRRMRDEFNEIVKPTIQRWKDAVAARREWVLDQIAIGDLPIRNSVNLRDKGAAFDTDGWEDPTGWYNCVHVAGTWANSYRRIGPETAKLGEWRRSYGNYACCETGNRANVFGELIPRVGMHLAMFMDVPLESLPLPLQHWTLAERYTGNQILNRIDPLHWAVCNPWLELKFRIFAATSRKALNARRRNLGLPPCKFKDNGDPILEVSQMPPRKTIIRWE